MHQDVLAFEKNLMYLKLSLELTHIRTNAIDVVHSQNIEDLSAKQAEEKKRLNQEIEKLEAEIILSENKVNIILKYLDNCKSKRGESRINIEELQNKKIELKEELRDKRAKKKINEEKINTFLKYLDGVKRKIDDVSSPIAAALTTDLGRGARNKG